MLHIMKCLKCNKYTLKKQCEVCGSITVLVKPPKYSPEDPNQEYRLKAKRELLKEKGLL